RARLAVGRRELGGGVALDPPAGAGDAETRGGRDEDHAPALPQVRGPLEPVGIRDARHDLAAPSRRPHVDRALRATIREAERRAPRAVRPASDAAPVVANARAHGIEAPGRPAEQALRAAVAEAARARLRSRYPEDRDEDGDPRDQSRMYDPVRMH